MTFHLTFNKPAVKHFIESDEEHTGLRICIKDGHVMFQPVVGDHDDAAVLEPRTRGGFKAVIEGENADDILKHLNNPNGPFFILHRHSKEWIEAIPYAGGGAPPKFEPHLRVWSDHIPKTTSKNKQSVPTRSGVTLQPVTLHEDPMERIRWAFKKIKEPRGPGRPSNEYQDAKAIAAAFEQEALSFVGQYEPQISSETLDAVVAAYRALGGVLRVMRPEVLAENFSETTSYKSGDEMAEEQVREAAHQGGFPKKSVGQSTSRLSAANASSPSCRDILLTSEQRETKTRAVFV